MGMIQSAEKWLFSVAARKVVIKGVTIVLAWLASGAVQTVLTSNGVSYDPVKLQAALTGTALAGLKALEDYINLKYEWNV